MGSGFRKFKWVSQIYMDFAHSLQISLALCGFHSRFRIPGQFRLTKHTLLFVHEFYKLFRVPLNLLRISQILLRVSKSYLFLERIWAIHCFSYLSVESKKAKTLKTSSNFANSVTNLILVSFGIRFQFTKCTVWPRNGYLFHLYFCYMQIQPFVHKIAHGEMSFFIKNIYINKILLTYFSNILNFFKSRHYSSLQNFWRFRTFKNLSNVSIAS